VIFKYYKEDSIYRYFFNIIRKLFFFFKWTTVPQIDIVLMCSNTKLAIIQQMGILIKFRF